MTRAQRRGYDCSVFVPRFSAPRWIAAGLGAFVLACCAVFPTPAKAATSSFDVGDQSVVTIFVKGRDNDVELRSWDRPTVQIESSDEDPGIERRGVVYGPGGAQPLIQTIPPQQWRLPDGTTQTVPPEDFPLAGMRAGVHDTIRVTVAEGTRLVVTVPTNIGLVRAVIGSGITTIDGYRGANLFLFQGNGRVALRDSTTTAFVQLGWGLFFADDDTFDRMRLRANTARVVFERCRTKQIESTTMTGSIVYDNGSFEPGLARFESLSGNIAVGTSSQAQLSGRSSDGHVYTTFDNRAVHVDQSSPGAAVANVGTGGPLVNALSTHGNVYLYDGSLRGRRDLPPEWRPVHQQINRRPPRQKTSRQRTIEETFEASRRRA